MRSDIAPGGMFPDDELPGLAANDPKIAVAYTQMVSDPGRIVQKDLDKRGAIGVGGP